MLSCAASRLSADVAVPAFLSIQSFPQSFDRDAVRLSQELVGSLAKQFGDAVDAVGCPCALSEHQI